MDTTATLERAVNRPGFADLPIDLDRPQGLEPAGGPTACTPTALFVAVFLAVEVLYQVARGRQQPRQIQ